MKSSMENVGNLEGVCSGVVQNFFQFVGVTP